MRYRSDENLKNKAILLVEDSEDLSLIGELILTKVGACVDVARSGQEAIEAAQEKAFDLVLMDLHLPDEDGISVSKMMRAGGFTKPIIAYSADDFQDVQEACLEGGFDDFIPKLVDKETLIMRLAKILEESF